MKISKWTRTQDFARDITRFEKDTTAPEDTQVHIALATKIAAIVRDEFDHYIELGMSPSEAAKAVGQRAFSYLPRKRTWEEKETGKKQIMGLDQKQLDRVCQIIHSIMKTHNSLLRGSRMRKNMRAISKVLG